MKKQIPDLPPAILPIPDGEERPLWSVMIPAYNCICYLKETIESVLVQDPGPELMQIEVIDDCSTDGDVEGLVYSVGRGRVKYYRQEYNNGSLRNFETCINRAQGLWVHLLHGDDKVKPGFYEEIKSLFYQHPEAGAAFTRHMVVDQRNLEFIKVNPLVGEVADKPGIIDNWLSIIAQRNRLQPPAMVVKRAVYEDLGSYYAVFFGEDWEMWVRIAAKYPVAYSPKRLAIYRLHQTNITTRSFTSGQTIKDLQKVIGIIETHLPVPLRKELHKKAKKNASRYIISNAYKAFVKHGNMASLLAQANGALKMYPGRRNFYLVFKVYVKLSLHLLMRKKKGTSSTKTFPQVRQQKILNLEPNE